MRNRICQVFLAGWPVVGQIFEYVVPGARSFRLADIMVAADGINADTGIVNGLHDLVPCFELALHRFGVFIAVDQITGNEDKINILLCNFGGKFA